MMATTTLAIGRMDFQNVWVELARVADLAEYVGANIEADNPKSALRLVTVTDTLIRLVREADLKMEAALTEGRKP